MNERTIEDYLWEIQMKRREAQKFRKKVEQQLVALKKKLDALLKSGKRTEKEISEMWEDSGEPLQRWLEEAVALEEQHDKVLMKKAKELPVWKEWGKDVHGIGARGIGQIVGECGDLNNYDCPAKLWKRMGLAVMPDGERQRRVKGSEEALEHGYCPRRRSVMYNIGKAFIKAGGPYREVYDRRKAYEEGCTQSGLHAEKVERDKLAAVAVAKGWTKENRERVAAGMLPKFIIDDRARRYAEKRFLRDLWKAWRKTNGNGPRDPC